MKNRSTGRLGGLFCNAVIPECFYRGSQPYEKTTRFPITTFGNDVRRGYSRGFTLIELLVVVLIIGILAAVALPQYQKAVMRARFAQLPIFARAIEEAGNRYYMANGTYASKIADLDLTFPGDLSEDGKSLTMGKYVCEYIGPERSATQSTLCYYYSENSDYGKLGYRIYHDSPQHDCVAQTSAPKGMALCTSMTATAPYSRGEGFLHYPLN